MRTFCYRPPTTTPNWYKLSLTYMERGFVLRGGNKNTYPISVSFCSFEHDRMFNIQLLINMPCIVKRRISSTWSKAIYRNEGGMWQQGQQPWHSLVRYGELGRNNKCIVTNSYNTHTLLSGVMNKMYLLTSKEHGTLYVYQSLWSTIKISVL